MKMVTIWCPPASRILGHKGLPRLGKEVEWGGDGPARVSLRMVWRMRFAHLGSGKLFEGVHLLKQDLGCSFPLIKLYPIDLRILSKSHGEGTIASLSRAVCAQKLRYANERTNERIRGCSGCKIPFKVKLGRCRRVPSWDESKGLHCPASNSGQPDLCGSSQAAHKGGSSALLFAPRNW